MGVFLNKRAYCATTAKIWGLTWKKHTKTTWNEKFLVFTDMVRSSTLMFEVLRVQPNSIAVTWLIRLKFGPKMVKNGPPRLLITRCKKYLAAFLSQYQFTIDPCRIKEHNLAIFVCIFWFIDFQNWDMGVFLNKRAYCATTAKIWGLTWKKHTKNTWNEKFLVFTDRVRSSTLMFEVQPNSISVTWLIRLKFGPKMARWAPQDC